MTSTAWAARAHCTTRIPSTLSSCTPSRWCTPAPQRHTPPQRRLLIHRNSLTRTLYKTIYHCITHHTSSTALLRPHSRGELARVCVLTLVVQITVKPPTPPRRQHTLTRLQMPMTQCVREKIPFRSSLQTWMWTKCSILFTMLDLYDTIYDV